MKYTFADVDNFIKNKNGKLLSTEYKNTEIKLKIQCNKCNHIWEPRFYHIKNRNQWCPKCAGNVKITYEEVRQFITNKNGILLSTEYKNIDKKLKVKCNKCNHIWKPTFNHIKNNNTWCPKCAGKTTILYKEVKQFIRNKNGTLLTLKNEYKNTNEKLKIQCNKCNHVWNVCFDALKNQNRWCPKCSKNAKITYEEVKNFIQNKNGKLLTLSEEYKNVKTKLKIQCNKCNYIWNPIFDSIKRNTWCPACNKFYHQELCRSILEQLLIYKFASVRPNWLKNMETNFNLELDGYCSELNIAFEYNGIQHYKVKKFGKSISDEEAKLNLKNQKKRDKLKKKLCKQNGTKLIIIPYWIEDINMENFIVRECQKLNVLISKTLQ
jgi:hypothetical protein